jgi:DNA sulfur modification protein DndB
MPSPLVVALPVFWPRGSLPITSMKSPLSNGIAFLMSPSLAKEFPLWMQVREGRLPASEVRDGYIHGHGIALQALGKAGNALLKRYPSSWAEHLPKLRKIDWSRANAKLWEGRALIGGKVSKVTTSVILTANIVKKSLGLQLSPEEKQIEDARSKGNKS